MFLKISAYFDTRTIMTDLELYTMTQATNQSVRKPTPNNVLIMIW